MATYFMRETDDAKCTGCGACIEACPVDVLTMEGDNLHLDENWCIGCGVCAPKCPTGAAKLRLRTDIEQSPPPTFQELHTQILKEKGLK